MPAVILGFELRNRAAIGEAGRRRRRAVVLEQRLERAASGAPNWV
jgi:hypothetical protein